jgi:hypothetical protein
MQIGHDVGARAHEVLVASLESGAAEIIRRQMALLQSGARGPVQDEDSLFQKLVQLGRIPAGHYVPPA